MSNMPLRLIEELTQIARQEGSSDHAVFEIVELLGTIPKEHHPAIFAIIRTFGSMPVAMMARFVDLTTA